MQNGNHVPTIVSCVPSALADAVGDDDAILAQATYSAAHTAPPMRPGTDSPAVNGESCLGRLAESSRCGNNPLDETYFGVSLTGYALLGGR